jgi:acyl-CoA thioesterase
MGQHVRSDRGLACLAAILFFCGCSLPQAAKPDPTEQAKRDAEQRAKLEAEVRAKLEAEVRAKLEAEARAKTEREAKEKLAAEQAAAERAEAETKAKTETEAKSKEEDARAARQEDLKVLFEDAKKRATEVDDYLLGEAKKLRAKADEAIETGKLYKARTEVLKRSSEAATDRLSSLRVTQCTRCGREQAFAKSCVFCGGEVRTVDRNPEARPKAERDYETALRAYQAEVARYRAQETIRMNAETDIRAIDSLRQQLRKAFDKMGSVWEAWSDQKASETDVRNAVLSLNTHINKGKSFAPAGTKPAPLAPLSTLGDPAKPAAGSETPRAVLKVYVMKDGKRIEVLSDMAAGDEVVLKKADGEMVTVKSADVERVEKP